VSIPPALRPDNGAEDVQPAPEQSADDAAVAAPVSTD
jgi:hypothetical protein